MKRLLSLLLTAALVLSLAACGGAPDSTPETPEPPAATDPETPETPPADAPETAPEGETPPAETPAGGEPSDSPSLPSAGTPAPEVQTSAPATQDAETPAAEDGPNILIAYFTWAENTVVADPSAVDVDASTSASVLLPGNAAKMAGWIRQEVGGDLFSIVVSDPYSSDYDECLDRAADEKADNARPALVGSVADMDQYDVVFIGFPNWWYTVPMAVLTFVESYDFSGKTIVPFVTHGTGGLSSTIRDLTAALPDDVTILESIGVYRPEVDASENTVRAWAKALDLA